MICTIASDLRRAIFKNSRPGVVGLWVASNLVRGNLVRVISYDLLNLIYLIII